MKHFRTLLAALLAIVGVSTAQAQEAYAALSSDGKTLTFYYDTQRATHGTTYSIPWVGDYPGWTSSAGNAVIETVTVDESFRTCDSLSSAKNMFYRLSRLQTINNPGMRLYKAQDMSNMFAGCSSLTSISLSRFFTREALTMEGMFMDCTSLESIDLNGLYVSQLDNTSCMFKNCRSLTAIVGMGALSVSYVTDMSEMFAGCRLLKNIDLTRFLPEKAQNMSALFSNCASLERLDLSSINASAATNMSSMFYGCSQLKELNVSGLRTENVESMESMFRGCTSLTTLDLRSFDTRSLAEASNMFWGCTALRTIYCNGTWSCPSSSGMFEGCTSLVGGNGTTYNAQVTDVTRARPDTRAVPGYFTSKAILYGELDEATGLLTLYYNANPYVETAGKTCYKMTVNGPEWRNNSKVTVVDLDVSVDECTDLTSMRYFFGSLRNLTEIRHLDRLHTENVTDMYSMFSSCNKLTNIDLSHFDTQNVTDMSSMFSGCQVVASLDLSSFDTRNVTSMQGMFQNCAALTTLDVSPLDTRNVTTMSSMFEGCSSLQSLDLSGFDMAKVASIPRMFQSCSALQTIYCNETWDIYGWYVFKDCTSLVGGNGTVYDANHVDLDYARPDGGPSEPGYFTAKPAFIMGDVNKDDKITIADVTALVNIILGKDDGPTPLYNHDAADVNGDKKVTIADVTALVNVILGK